MTYTMRPYTGAADLEKLQRFTAQNIHQVGDCGQFHVGDIAHHIYSALRKYNPSEVVKLWEDKHGDLVGWLMVLPKWSSYQFFVRPELWQSDLPAHLLTQAEQLLPPMIAAALPESTDPITFRPEALICDLPRIQLYEAHGYTDGGHFMTITERSLARPIPDVPLPDGYTIRTAIGDQDAEQLAAVHHGAFNSNWTGPEYRTLMNTPGYAAENEWIVVAPDGTFAAFTVIWFDWLNKSILFEPVGTHRDYHRRGLGRALMTAVMKAVYAQGIETAIVLHETKNEASTGLYHALGFETKHEIHTYQKTIVA